MKNNLDKTEHNVANIQKQLDSIKVQIDNIQTEINKYINTSKNNNYDTLKENILKLENNIKIEKNKFKNLFEKWTEYANTPSYRLLEKNHLRKKELAHIEQENSLLGKLLNEESEDKKFEYSREYLDFFRKNKYKQTFFQLSMISDSFLGFFRNTTSLIFLTVSTRYFYNNFSWDLNFILIGLCASFICLILCFLLNCLFLLNALTEKLTEESVRLERFKLLILTPAYFSYFCSIIVIWNMAGKYL
ncbi:hypothetical protein [Wielerella bovis]|uniref:hypothetical protein n=1 Tax=Wielerella bovis TaxID=2917790 RepID=UPI002019A9A6|nr:hypothetical protein [Wielerella bovis]ULJ59590.1 hypothetical protein MIS44_07780 [Wielerella bovis]